MKCIVWAFNECLCVHKYKKKIIPMIFYVNVEVLFLSFFSDMSSDMWPNSWPHDIYFFRIRLSFIIVDHHGSWLIAVDQKIYAFAVKSRLKPTRPTSLSGDPTTVQIWNLNFDYYRFDVVSKSFRMLCVLIV